MSPKSSSLPSALCVVLSLAFSGGALHAGHGERDLPGGPHGAPVQATGAGGQVACETDNHFAFPPLWQVGGIRAIPFLASGPGGYTPVRVRHAYGFDRIGSVGAGQTIAIVDAYGSPTLAADVGVFCNTFGLPQASLAVYYPQGKPAANSGWALETSLDVEWAHAIAPGARIVVVIAKTSSLTNLLGAVDYAVKTLGAKQVSMSWGASEFSSEKRYDSHFNRAGVTFFASSGDSGAGVIWPAASPYVVAVGGTTPKLDAAGNVTSETGWSGSGGGVSAYESRPVYQNGWQTTTKRTVPDVSYDADPSTGFPVYISNYNRSTGWITVGGTSAGAPQWAGLQALANAVRATPLSGADTALYSLASTNYSQDFFDITSGSNGGFTSKASYDYVTGLGSPNAPSLVTGLIGK